LGFLRAQTRKRGPPLACASINISFHLTSQETDGTVSDKLLTILSFLFISKSQDISPVVQGDNCTPLAWHAICCYAMPTQGRDPDFYCFTFFCLISNTCRHLRVGVYQGYYSLIYTQSFISKSLNSLKGRMSSS
jgi:hypothetical protein